MPDGRAFSPLWKARTTSRIAWMMLGLYAVVPVATIALLPPDRPGWTARLVTDGIALLVTAGAILAASDSFGVRGFRELRRRFTDRMVEIGIDPERCGAYFVGLAPSREARVYESFGDWDVGWLFLQRRRLCWIGEQARFALTREQITGVEIGPGLPGWIPAPRVVITWRDGACGTEGAVSLRPADTASLSGIAAGSRALFERIGAWRRGVLSPHPEPALGDLALPPSGAVTSLAPGTYASAASAMRGLLLCSLAVAAAAAALGLSFDPGRAGFADALLGTWSAQILYLAPWWRSQRESTRPAPESVLDHAA
ncbi:MAG: hypothetical protein HYR73_05080 [Candidatus Eisenbacteria bacterium]|nr:hypothetical protein [Candidatus Eisenbacteria bacterium]